MIREEWEPHHFHEHPRFFFSENTKFHHDRPSYPPHVEEGPYFHPHGRSKCPRPHFQPHGRFELEAGLLETETNSRVAVEHAEVQLKEQMARVQVLEKHVAERDAMTLELKRACAVSSHRAKTCW